MNTKKYLDLFEYHKADEAGTNDRARAGWWSFSNDALEQDDHQPFSDLIHSSDLDEDSAYTFTVEALQAMQDQGEVTAKHELEDISQYSEAPIYNNVLVEWMAKGTNWTLIDEAIAEYGDFDSSTSILGVISYAYSKAWEDHYFKVLEIVRGK